NAIKAAYLLIQGLESLEKEGNERAESDPHYGAVHHPINFNPGFIKGGDWASSCPAWCDVVCRFGLLPGGAGASCRRETRAGVGRGLLSTRNRGLRGEDCASAHVSGKQPSINRVVGLSFARLCHAR